jgi:hypothetical protein
MALGTVKPDGSIEPLPRGDWRTINATLERIAVPGGWLYRSRHNPTDCPMTFVPSGDAVAADAEALACALGWCVARLQKLGDGASEAALHARETLRKVGA